MSSSSSQSVLATIPADDAIRSKVRAYIIENFLLGSAEGFEDDTRLMENGILDSTAAMELVPFLEETFNIVVEDAEVVPENLNSVDNICRFVARKSG